MNDETAKALTAAILALNANIEKLTSALHVGEQIASDAPESPVEQPQTEPAPVVSRDDLQASCMSLVRSDRANKAKIVALLDSYGVKTITALADAHLADFSAKLGVI